MKKTSKLIMVIIMSFYFSGNCLAEETIRLTTGEWAPFISEELEHGGVALHVITDAFAAVGIKVEYGFYPWSRAKHLAQNGDWDGTAIWGVSSERERDFYYSDLVMISPFVLFHLKSYPLDWNSWDDLVGIPMGGVSDTNYGTDFDRLNQAGKMEVQWVVKVELNFRKLLVGRIKFTPLELDVGYHIINSNFSDKKAKLFTHHPKPDLTGYYHLLLSKNVERNKEILFLFNKGLRHLRENGKYDEYFENLRNGKYLKATQ